MKILNLDRRFANYPRYKCALQFRGRTQRQINRCEERKKYAAAFEKIYGPAWIKNPNYEPGKSSWNVEHITNPQWMFDSKHNRIYYQEESTLSMVMLMIGTA